MVVTIIGKSNFAGKIAKVVTKSVFIEIEERIFPDDEVCPRLLISDENQLKGSHAVIAMQLESNQPRNQYLISLFWTIYNVKRYNPERISCIMPYHLYSRQDRESRKGEPISSLFLALALEAAGINDFVTFNSHTYGKVDINQFFSNSHASDLSAIPILGTTLKSRLTNPQETICLAPDEGALFLAKEIAKILNTSFFAAIQKYRDPETGEISQKLIGIPFEIENRSVVIIDDLVSSGKTMIGAAQILKKKGAKEVIFAYIHAVHSPTSFSLMQEVNPTLIITTDTIETDISGLTTVSVIPLISSWIEENSKL
ncbi:MAG: ribose-phosphate pyrophosphokinase [Candidatus Heimdallarchaeota archaeon]|nr:MAG: ribose-phosphate pyrophosphokinase [Candidatus Heimdallarchaeota archaeon]